jgi:hypothetical protein
MKIPKSLPTNLKLHREFKVILNYICWINRTINITIYQNKCKLNIKITISLLQQYLIKYIDKPQQALENIEEMQKIYNASDVSTSAEQSGFYS